VQRFLSSLTGFSRTAHQRPHNRIGNNSIAVLVKQVPQAEELDLNSNVVLEAS
jgi:hypothetical protein